MLIDMITMNNGISVNMKNIDILQCAVCPL